MSEDNGAEPMKQKIKENWDYLQSLLDIDGDVILLAYSMAIVYKTLHGGLTIADATAYSAAVGAFAYSNKGPKV